MKTKKVKRTSAFKKGNRVRLIGKGLRVYSGLRRTTIGKVVICDLQQLFWVKFPRHPHLLCCHQEWLVGA